MQIFHRSTNTVAKVSIFGAIFFLGFFGWVYSTLLRSSYVTGQDVIRKQPVPFSHQHHVSELGIDCRYCHTSVETSSFAGIPPTKTCMNCHSQLWANSPILEPVRASFRDGKALQWTRVYDLPDFVYFNHSIHVAKGIGCTTCHGEIGRMPLTWKASSLKMEWCLACHRDPARFVRPREEVFNPDWEPSTLSATQRAALVKEYKITSKTSCSVCHR